MNEAAMVAWGRSMGMNVEAIKNNFRPTFTCVDESKPKTRYCRNCDCSQFGGLFDPCWQCGETKWTLHDKNWNMASWDNAHHLIQEGT